MNECVTWGYDVTECFLPLPNRLIYFSQSFIHFCYLIILNKFNTAFDTFENSYIKFILKLLLSTCIGYNIESCMKVLQFIEF